MERTKGSAKTLKNHQIYAINLAKMKKSLVQLTLNSFFGYSDSKSDLKSDSKSNSKSDSKFDSK